MKAFFLPVAGSRRFCLIHVPPGPIRGAVLQVAAFAEEQNLARRTSSLQARAFATAGFAVLQMDLFGCGDSEGVFADAKWDRWIDDVLEAERWLRTETSYEPVLWGVRAGCLLAAEAAAGMGRPAHFIFWQPVVSGARHWRQFQRIGQIGDMLASAEEGAAVPSSGTVAVLDSVEVAGYRVSAELQAGLAAADLALPAVTARVDCVEVNARDGQITPALQARIGQWRAAGHQVQASSVVGPAYWQAAEAPDCPALIEATTRLLAAVGPVQ